MHMAGSSYALAGLTLLTLFAFVCSACLSAFFVSFSFAGGEYQESGAAS